MNEFLLHAWHIVVFNNIFKNKLNELILRLKLDFIVSGQERHCEMKKKITHNLKMVMMKKLKMKRKKYSVI